MVPYLDRRDERYVGGFVEHLVVHTPTRLPRLEAFMTQGRAATDAAAPGPFETFYRDEQATRAFVEAMWNLSYAASHELARLAGLRDGELLVDVGGASGPFAIAALQHRPGLRAVVFDLPPVEPYLREAGRAHGVADRLDFVPGDFFNDDLPEGDCIAFGYVLSDWTDQTCLGLLRKAYRACRPGGRVLIMERLFDDDRRGPLATAVMNLEMHVETRGRHRTAAEYTDLLAEAGFGTAAVRRSSREKHLVTGHKERPACGADMPGTESLYGRERSSQGLRHAAAPVPAGTSRPGDRRLRPRELAPREACAAAQGLPGGYYHRGMPSHALWIPARRRRANRALAG